jgi:hypothetical protein
MTWQDVGRDMYAYLIEGVWGDKNFPFICGRKVTKEGQGKLTPTLGSG